MEIKQIPQPLMNDKEDEGNIIEHTRIIQDNLTSVLQDLNEGNKL